MKVSKICFRYASATRLKTQRHLKRARNIDDFLITTGVDRLSTSLTKQQQTFSAQPQHRRTTAQRRLRAVHNHARIRAYWREHAPTRVSAVAELIENYDADAVHTSAQKREAHPCIV